VAIIRKLRIDRDATTSKIQEELRRFEPRPFVGKLVTSRAANRPYA
jgi:hypothetical protein